MKLEAPEVSKDSSRIGVLPSSLLPRIAILIVLGVMAVISTYVGVKEAAFSDPKTEGIDFQWSGAHLLSQHENPWSLYIEHKDKGKIILGQQPNYLAELFLILWPLGRMPFQDAVLWWCGFNLAFTAGVIYVTRRMFLLDRNHTLLVMFLLMASTPFRVTLHIGQHGLFVLMMLCLAFFSRNLGLRALALGLSYCKYSFAPVIVLMLLVRRRVDVVLMSLIPPLVGLLVAWGMLGGSLWTLAIEPLAVAKMAMSPGHGDVMTFSEALLRNLHTSPALTFAIPSALGLFASAVGAIWIGRSRGIDDKLQFAVALILTLLCTKHVAYDFVVLVVPVAAAVMAPKSKSRIVVLLCALHFWFLAPLVGHIFSTRRVYALEVLIYAGLLLGMAIATSRLYSVPKCGANLIPVAQ